MDQHISQEEIRRIIISDMVKKRNSIVPNFPLTSMKERGYYGLSLLPQYSNKQGRFLDDFMDFVCKNASDIKQKSEVMREIKKKLFIHGCNLPNWLFRFLWQPTQTGRNSNLKTTQGYWINKEKPEDSFENFLKKKNLSADELNDKYEIVIGNVSILDSKIESTDKVHLLLLLR